MTRFEGRLPEELRPLKITPNYLSLAEGSALINLGRTWVICTATVEERVPPFLPQCRPGLDHGGVRHAAPVHAHPAAPGRGHAAV